MYVPLRYAVSIPVATFALAAAVWQFFKALSVPPTGGGATTSELPLVPFVAFAVAAVALTTVPSNLAAAFAANRFGAGDTAVYLSILTAVSALGNLATGGFMNSLFRSSHAVDFSDWRTYAFIAANSGILSLSAVVFGTGND